MKELIFIIFIIYLGFFVLRIKFYFCILNILMWEKVMIVLFVNLVGFEINIEISF